MALEINKDRWDTIVIGAGQAGLAVSYYLKKAGIDHIVLDSNSRTGDTWRNRWDSLKLFTPAEHDSLPGLPFPAPRGTFPGKEEMASYLENYADKFKLPVAAGIKVKKLISKNSHMVLEHSGGVLSAEKVVVATGTNPVPNIPKFAKDIAPEINQIHSSQYKNPDSLPDSETLVVGCGTSGAEIAIELAGTRPVKISGKPTPHIPDAVLKYLGEPYWWFVSNIVTVKTPIGRKAKKSILKGGAPLIRISVKHLEKAGVERLPKVKGINNGLPVLENGRTVSVSNIVWATGYKPDFSWIDAGENIFDDKGWPVTQRGVPAVKNLFFAGMLFQYGLTSGLVGGVGRDAEFIVNKILGK